MSGPLNLGKLPVQDLIGKRIISLLAIAILVATACSPATQGGAGSPTPMGTASGEPIATASSEATAGSEIVIGGTGPLSQPGDVAGGTELKWALEQAVADLNAKGGVLGRPVRLVFYDSQNKPDICAAVAKRLVEEDKVVAVAGEYHSGCALAQIPTYNEAGIPVVFAETYSDSITAGDPADPNLPPNPPTIFRIAPTSTYYTNFIFDWLLNGAKVKSLMHIVDNTDYGVGSAKAMQAAVAGTNIKLSQITIEPAQPDYASIFQRAKHDNPDSEAVMFDITDTASTWVAQQNGIDVGLVDDAVCVGGPAARDSAGYWRAVPDGVGCTFQFVGMKSSQFNDLAKSLNERAKTELGHEARNYAFEAYDSVLLVADAIERAGNTDAKAIVAALEETQLVGAQGKYEFPYNSTNPVPADQPSWLWHQWPEPVLQILEYTERGQTADQAVTLWPESGQTTPGQSYVKVER